MSRFRACRRVIDGESYSVIVNFPVRCHPGHRPSVHGSAQHGDLEFHEGMIYPRSAQGKVSVTVFVC